MVISFYWFNVSFSRRMLSICELMLSIYWVMLSTDTLKLAPCASISSLICVRFPSRSWFTSSSLIQSFWISLIFWLSSLLRRDNSIFWALTSSNSEINYSLAFSTLATLSLIAICIACSSWSLMICCSSYFRINSLYSIFCSLNPLARSALWILSSWTFAIFACRSSIFFSSNRLRAFSPRYSCSKQPWALDGELWD